MKNILMLVPTKDFKDLDYTEPLAVLKHDGHTVTIAAQDWRCEGSLGTVVRPNLLIRNINPRDFDALFIVGGVGARDLAVDIAVIDLVQEFAKEKKVVAAIGNGVVVFAAAGLLTNRYAAAAVVDEDFVASKGARLVKQTVVVDGNVVTAVGSRVAYETGQVFANLLL